MPYNKSYIPDSVVWLSDQNPKHKHDYEPGGRYHTKIRLRGDGWRGKKDPLFRGDQVQHFREPAPGHGAGRVYPHVNPLNGMEYTDWELASLRTARSPTHNNAPDPYEVESPSEASCNQRARSADSRDGDRGRHHDRRHDTQSRRGRSQGLLTNDWGDVYDDFAYDRRGRAHDPRSHRHTPVPSPERDVSSTGYGAISRMDSRRPDPYYHEPDLVMTRERPDLGGGRHNYHHQSSGRRMKMVRHRDGTYSLG